MTREGWNDCSPTVGYFSHHITITNTLHLKFSHEKSCMLDSSTRDTMDIFAILILEPIKTEVWTGHSVYQVPQKAEVILQYASQG